MPGLVLEVEIGRIKPALEREEFQCLQPNDEGTRIPGGLGRAWRISAPSHDEIGWMVDKWMDDEKPPALFSELTCGATATADQT